MTIRGARCRCISDKRGSGGTGQQKPPTSLNPGAQMAGSPPGHARRSVATPRVARRSAPHSVPLFSAVDHPPRTATTNTPTGRWYPAECARPAHRPAPMPRSASGSGCRHIIDNPQARHGGQHLACLLRLDRPLEFHRQRHRVRPQHRHPHAGHADAQLRLVHDLAQLAHHLGLFLVVAARRVHLARRG